ncbi:type II secretion system F family protein [Variovorax sp. YR752]|uniref:type II secretion system F family protein n=1 Tax=Variovorax sp. YR752 TaxID=1884383 RepID=UPI003137988E
MAASEFMVRYFDARRAGVVEESARAHDAEALRRQLSEQGHVVLEVRPAEASGVFRFKAKIPFDVAWWCRELRTLLLAGMTVVEALETLEAQSVGSARAEVQSALLKSLREGKPLSDAMDASGYFPKVLIASVTASERTSTLPTALEDYLAYDELLARLRRQVVSAAVYPAVVVSLGLLVTMFLLVYVIPRFSKMYVNFKGAVSWPTQVLLGISDALGRDLPLVLGGLIVLAALMVVLWRRGLWRTWGEAFIEAVPVLRRGKKHFSHAKLYQALALMFRGGYPLEEALAVGQALGLGRRHEEGIAQARASISRGKSVAESFANAGLADPLAQRLLAVGERSGNFDRVLATIAQRHAQIFETFVERATRLVEPLLLLVVALVVGGIVVMMYMPIFDIAGGLR